MQKISFEPRNTLRHFIHYYQKRRSKKVWMKHSVGLTTAGEGTWILATERGRMWLARWHKTTPSISAAPTSSGNKTFNLDSRFCKKKKKHPHLIPNKRQVYHMNEPRIIHALFSHSGYHIRSSPPRTAHSRRGGNWRWPEIISKDKQAFHCECVCVYHRL